MRNLKRTSVGYELAVPGVAEALSAILVKSHTGIYGEGEVLEEAYLGIAVGGQGIALCFVLVEGYGLKTVGVGLNGPEEAGVCTVTVVVTDETVVVIHMRAVGVAYVQRIYRRDAVGEGEDVAGRSGTLLTVAVSPVVVGVGHVSTDLEPLLYLIIGAHAGSETVHAFAEDYTLVVEVSQ